MKSVPAEETVFCLVQFTFGRSESKDFNESRRRQDAPLTANEDRAILNFFGSQARMHEVEELLLARDFAFPHVNYLDLAVGRKFLCDY
jgi:hypothetical protein